LRGGLIAIRRRKVQRLLRNAAGVCVIAVLLSATLIRKNLQSWSTRVDDRSTERQAPGAAAEVIAGTNIRVLSDSELLDLFPGHSVALIRTRGEQKLIIFDAISN
jgi:hypothetical protein